MSSSLWLLLLFIVIYTMQGIHCVMPNTPGEIQPPRLEIKINSNANITCRVNPTKFGSNVNSSSLYFVEEDTGNRVPQTDIEILNENTIVFMLRNASEQDRNYVCKSGVLAIGVIHVSVGTAPLDVTDFKCRGYDYTYMVCNFTLPYNVILTKYDLNYTTQSLLFMNKVFEKGRIVNKPEYSQNYIQICPLEIHQRQAICNMTLEQNNYRTYHEFFNFTLRGENDVGTNVQSFWINNYESVIPPRPEYTFEKITNDSVIIKWYNNKHSFYAAKGLEYEVLLRPKNRDIDWMNYKDYTVPNNNRSEYKMIVYNIPYAYFLYELSVRVRVIKSSAAHYDESYWSEPFIREFRTSACPPATAPLTDVGSFYIDPTETQLRLYWHEIPDYLENGPDFKYIIKQVKVDGVEVSMKPLHIDRISAVFSWNRRQRYEFVVKSQNAKGESANNSIIVIPPLPSHYEGSTSPEWIKNEYDPTKHTYSLSWSPPKYQEGLIDYTVFWCQSKKATPNECEGSIYFSHVNKSATRFDTSPQTLNQDLNLAISANYRDFNSGMHWMCAADITSDLAKMEPEVIFISSRNITVQWSSDHVCPSLLEGYNITYCRLHHGHSDSNEKLTCAEKPITHLVPSNRTKFLIKRLHPHSTYQIQMVMYSKVKYGKLSDVLIVNTTEEAPSKPLHLRAQNITSNSAVLTWLAPEHRNGILRKYRIEFNNEHHIIDCLQDATICSNKKMTFTLENLSGYTRYKVYIVAYTVAASNHSNDITIETMVGIPSNPRHIKTKEKSQNIIQWSEPEVPSGRVEFYQVAIMVWYKDVVQRQHISNVVGSRECVFHLPVCIDADYRFTLQVRAVNAAKVQSEVDRYLFATWNVTTEYSDSSQEAAYYTENEDLKCEGIGVSSDKQRALLKEYTDSLKYVQYKSVWEKGPVTNCSDAKLSRITMMALLVVVSSLGVMAAFYVARNKYQKMANISCALPPGLEAMTHTTKNDDRGDFRRSKDSFYNNESRHLLSSISHDSGYICHTGDQHQADGVGIEGITSGSLGKSSGYMGSDHSTQYCTVEAVMGDSCLVEQTQIVGEDYMDMERLKQNDNNLKSSSSSIVFDNTLELPANNCGYVDVNNVAITALSGNISMKPHNIFNIPTQKFPPTTTTSAMPTIQTDSTPSMYDSGYFAPQRNILQPSATDGYTSVEAVSKMSAPVDAGGGISGYVTPRELSAFGQQTQFN